MTSEEKFGVKPSANPPAKAGEPPTKTAPDDTAERIPRPRWRDRRARRRDERQQAEKGETTAKAVADGPHGRPDPGQEGGHSRDGRKRLIIGLVALAVAAALIVVVTQQGSGSDNKVGGGSQSRVERGSTAGALDGFTRANLNNLGQSDNGMPWISVSGTWGIRDNTAYVAKSVGTLKRNMAVIDVGYPDGTAQVTLKTMASGSGLIFRYAGPFDYWVVYSVPQYGVWNVFKISGVVGERVTNFQGPTRNGTTVSVDMNGPALDFYIDGILRKSAKDPCQVGSTAGCGTNLPGDAKRVGLVAAGPDASKARFAHFVASVQSAAAPNADKKAPAGTPPATRTPPST